MKAIELTELEKRVGKALEVALYAECDFSDVECTDLAKTLELPVNTIKGVIGSLTKKGIAYTFDSDTNFRHDQLLELKPQYHKNWAEEQGLEYINLWD